jgi:nucleoside-diphosphate-sugar epimerase
MTAGLNLVTGATGFLGSHIVERLVQEGRPVRVLVRPSSDTAFLDSLGVEKVVGDLTDPVSVERVCRDVETVYHAAAKVVDWGPWDEFRKHIIEATDTLAQAARRASVRRFLHVSSVSAYEGYGRPDRTIDETAPIIGRTDRWDYYGRAKAQTERNLWMLYEQGVLPLTVVRPAWIYGPRDRTALPRFHRMLTTGRICLLGSGRSLVSTIFVGNAVEMCLRAATDERAVGQAYNCSSDGPITQRDLLGLWAAAFGVPAPRRRVPYCLALWAGIACEGAGHLLGRRTPPVITRHSIRLLRRPYFSCDKARQQLGWQPAVSYPQGIALTAHWYLEQPPAK